jgi:hypothetical protein
LNGRRVIVAGLLVAAASLACAPVPGEGKFVRITTEEAIIVWDEGAKREHFIRRASFDTDAKDFGFLVPTPGRPELGEADDKAFDLLAGITRAADARLGQAKSLSAEKDRAARPAAVTVLELKEVAGYNAAVLEATDARALDAWLKRNGYSSSPELAEWLEPYIAQHWKITAFKIAGDAPRLRTSAVRMSFQAHKPFFPYREPASQRAGRSGERALSVYVLADARFEGSLGSVGVWPGQVVWANHIDESQRTALLKLAGLPVLAGGGGRWLTKFEDQASPRPGTDEVFFSRSLLQAPIGRAPTGEQALLEPTSGRAWTALAALGTLLAAGVAYGAWQQWRRSGNG